MVKVISILELFCGGGILLQEDNGAKRWWDIGIIGGSYKKLRVRGEDIIGDKEGWRLGREFGVGCGRWGFMTGNFTKWVWCWIY